MKRIGGFASRNGKLAAQSGSRLLPVRKGGANLAQRTQFRIALLIDIHFDGFAGSV